MSTIASKATKKMDKKPSSALSHNESNNRGISINEISISSLPLSQDNKTHARRINYQNGHRSISFILDDNLSIIDQEDLDDDNDSQQFDLLRNADSLHTMSSAQVSSQTNERNPSICSQM